MATSIGIDLNGLRDVSVDTVDKGVLRGGDVPSVVIVLPRKFGAPLRVIAGKEAAMAMEGRGWHWPESARIIDERQSLRVPLQRILEALSKGQQIEAASETLTPTDLLSASIEALARPRGRAAAEVAVRPVVIAVPDDGRFLEEGRQRLIDAAVQAGLTPTLLWRPVAALLGLEPQLNEEDVDKIEGRSVGVLSCLEDGVHASRLEVEVETDDDGQRYFVPVRKKSGIIIPFRRPISELAKEVAHRYAPHDDPHAGWQLLWGNGLALSWLLRLDAKDTMVQTSDGWQLVPSTPPQDLPQVEFDEATLDELNRFLKGVDYRIYEGPALETSCHGDRLEYFLREQDVMNTRSLYLTKDEQHLAARGCVIYQQRQDLGRHTYYDHLPQLRLAVRRGEDPSFLDLIDPTARIEGGMPYDDECDLGLSVQPGANALDFYLQREGNTKPRYIQVELRERLTRATPVQLRIHQRPAQGTARLTLVAVEGDSQFRPVELRWERMTEEDLTEEEIFERLRDKPVDVPPVQPQPCHALLWSAPIADAGGSLAQVVPMLDAHLSSSQSPSHELLPLLKGHSLLLTRRSSPALLTRRRVNDWTLYRAVSSDGATPEPDSELASSLIKKFDTCVDKLDKIISSGLGDDPTLRDAIVRFGGWCFLRCPDGIRRYMLETAISGNVPNAQIFFRAMGKICGEKSHFQTFFGLLERQLTGSNTKFKLYEIEGLFYLLSIRADAPFALTGQQAILFACKLLDRVEERLQSRQRLSRLVNISLKTYAGLMRYRLVRPDYMTEQDPDLGERQKVVLEKLMQRSQHDGVAQIMKLTKSLIEWSEKRGTDRTILQWDDEEGGAPELDL